MKRFFRKIFLLIVFLLALLSLYCLALRQNCAFPWRLMEKFWQLSGSQQEAHNKIWLKQEEFIKQAREDAMAAAKAAGQSHREAFLAAERAEQAARAVFARSDNVLDF